MKFTLITGASSGIGAQMASILASKGQNLILVSNQAEQLEQVAIQIMSQNSVVVKWLDINLATTDAAEQIYNAAKQWGEVDCLISNAGVLHFGKALSVADSYVDFITTLHYITPVKLCRLFGKDMVARGNGRIMLVSSMTAWTPYPTMSLYGSTKVALKSFAQSLWYELRGAGVSVTTIFPGAVDTPLYNLSPSHRKLFRTLGVMLSAEQVAKRAVRAMERRRRTLVPGLFTKIAVAACKILPAATIVLVMKIPVVKRLLERL